MQRDNTHHISLSLKLNDLPAMQQELTASGNTAHANGPGPKSWESVPI